MSGPLLDTANPDDFAGLPVLIPVPQAAELLGIDRTAELLANEAAAALGIAPAVAAIVDGCLVTSFVACRALEQSELIDAVEQIARALRAFHDSGVQLPTRFWVPELLEAVIENNIVADFPLCNKSFNCSYSGQDL